MWQRGLTRSRDAAAQNFSESEYRRKMESTTHTQVALESVWLSCTGLNGKYSMIRAVSSLLHYSAFPSFFICRYSLPSLFAVTLIRYSLLAVYRREHNLCHLALQ